MERRRTGSSLLDDQSLAVADGQGYESLGVVDAGSGRQATQSQGESERPHSNGLNTNSSEGAGGIAIHGEEEAISSNGAAYEGRRANMEENGERVSLMEGHFMPRSPSRSSIETSKTAHIMPSGAPVIADEEVSGCMAAGEKKDAQNADAPVTPLPSKEMSTNNSGGTGGVDYHGEEKASPGEGNSCEDRCANMEEKVERVSLIERQFMDKSHSRSSIEASKTASTRLSDAPAIIDKKVSDGLSAEEKDAENADSPITGSSSEESSTNNSGETGDIAFHGEEKAICGEGKSCEDRCTDIEQKDGGASSIGGQLMPRSQSRSTIENSARIRLSDAPVILEKDVDSTAAVEKEAQNAESSTTFLPSKETSADSSGETGGIVVHGEEKILSERDIHQDEGADVEDKVERASHSDGQYMPKTQSRSSLEKSKTTRITLSDVPVIFDKSVDDGMAAGEEKVQKSDSPITSSPSNEASTKRMEAERLRFRSTLATFINDDKGLYGEWRAKERAATAAAKDLLQVLAERVETLLNEATAVTGRLLCRRNTFHEEELRRRAGSKKRSSSLFPSWQADNACAEKIDECGGETEQAAELTNHRGGGIEAQQFRCAAATESDTGLVKRVAADFMDNLLTVAIQHKDEMSPDQREEGRQKKGSIMYKEASEGDSPISGINPDASHERQTSAEKGRYSFEEPHPGITSQFSRSSLESYNAAHFPEDFLTYPKQECQVPTGIVERAREQSVGESKARESSQTKRDKLWKILGRETQAGRLLYQLYKPAEPGGDLVYPIPKSIKDLRGNPNFRVLTHESSSSLAAAAGRHQNRRPVKVAVPRVGRHAARGAAAEGGTCKKFEKGNFLNGRGPGGKRSARQIVKETEKRRMQILEEASFRGVAASAMGLKRDREKMLMLEKLPYTMCRLLPEAARLPPLSARDRAVFFAEKAAVDWASLYSAGSASPSPRARNSSENPDASSSSSSRRICTTATSGCSPTSPRTARIPNYCCSNQRGKSLGRCTLDPCTQTLVPYVAAARQRYKKQGLIDAETGMTEEQKRLFVQILKEIQLRKQKLENLQKALPDHVLAASLLPIEEQCTNQRLGKKDYNHDNRAGGRPCSTDGKTSRPQSGVETLRKEANLFTSCFSSDVAKSRLAQRAILQQLQDETRLKREIGDRMKELETLISISDTQQVELKRNRQPGAHRFNC